jgi:hypothetical protein
MAGLGQPRVYSQRGNWLKFGEKGIGSVADAIKGRVVDKFVQRVFKGGNWQPHKLD